MKTYRVLLATDPAATVDHQAAVTIAAENHQDAALQVFANVYHDHPARRAWRDGRPVRAWVWDRSGPSHPNGSPMCVHGLDLERGAPRPAGSVEAPRPPRGLYSVQAWCTGIGWAGASTDRVGGNANGQHANREEAQAAADRLLQADECWMSGVRRVRVIDADGREVWTAQTAAAGVHR